jgi:hypothetical protein
MTKAAIFAGLIIVSEWYVSISGGTLTEAINE